MERHAWELATTLLDIAQFGNLRMCSARARDALTRKGLLDVDGKLTRAGLRAAAGIAEGRRAMIGGVG